MRLCPTCRMAISVLATKCRYCGEPVGRPRDESRKLTVNDLGGMGESMYAPSENVLDAMEAFRQEELATAQAHKEEEPKGWFGHKKHEHKGPEPGESPPGTLAQLDARSRDLASFGTSSSRRSTMVRRERVWTKKLAIVAGAVAAIIILYFGGLSAKAKIDEYFAKRNAKPVVHVENRAVRLLAEGAPGVDTLAAALEALKQDRSGENLKIADDARAKVTKDVDALLSANPWSIQLLDKASNIVTRAIDLDPNSPAIKELKKEVNEEIAAYKITIAHLDYAAGTVTLRVGYSDPNRPPDLVVKKKDDMLNGRFRVKRITPQYVSLEDPVRKGSGSLPRYFSLSLDGTISVQ